MQERAPVRPIAPRCRSLVTATVRGEGGDTGLRVASLQSRRYHPGAMVPPRWPDEQGRPIPTYPCPRCGLEVASWFEGSA
jgi:hypothetical protein